MLFRLFAKESFDLINQELEALFEALAVSKLKIRIQPATYSKPYNYIAEGWLEGYRFVVSLYSSELKEPITKQQMELMVYCENPNWMVLQAHHGRLPKQKKKTLGLERIDSLELLNANQMYLESNQKALAETIFDNDTCHQLLTLGDATFESFKLERKRLYYKTAWLPKSSSQKAILAQALKLGIALCKQID